MRIKLPEAFEKRMQELLQEEYGEYVKSYDNCYRGGIRANTLKLTPKRLQELSSLNLRRIPFIENGFYYEEKEQPAKSPYYFAGLYYIQEPSAMTPASLLPVKPGDKVLDLCAAPGGKSTELAARLQGKGVMVSNDISNSRAKALLKNIELFGVRNGVVISEPSQKLAESFYGYFDRILVDAPCSGEGMFRKQPAIMKNWEQYGVGYYNKLQREILPQAIKMLKPGGYLLYSTCTFSPEENEGTISFLTEQYPEMKVVPAIYDSVSEAEFALLDEEDQIRLKEMKDRDSVSYQGFGFGHPEWVENGKEELKHCIRLWPHKLEGEGHFITLLKKEGGESAHAPYYTVPQKETKLISQEAIDFIKRLNFDIDLSRITVRDDRLYLLPEEIIDLKGLRVLRSGLLLGEMKKNRFEPSQALASSLKFMDYDNVYDMEADDMDVIRYLKCESITIKKEVKDGWLLVCVNGYPLGWGKYSKGNFKNKYLPGWRLM